MNKKILVTVSSEMYDQVEEVQQKLGHMSIAETGRYAFQALVKKELDNYVEMAKKRMKDKQNPKKVSTKKAKAQEQQAQICTALDGKVTENPDGKGQSLCTYTVYEELPGKKIDKTVQNVPLDSLQEDMVEYQYKTLTGKKGGVARNKIKGMLRDK